MPSKISKPSRTPRPSPWRVEPACSEAELARTARDLSRELRNGDRILLTGPMGVGKTTFARALLEGLGIDRMAEGSPTFAIAHEYPSPVGDVVHLDLYRLDSEGEAEAAGVNAYFWEREAVVLVEWLERLPDLARAVRAGGACWEVKLGFVASDATRRTVEVFQRT